MIGSVAPEAGVEAPRTAERRPVAAGRGAGRLRSGAILLPFVVLFVTLSVASGPFLTRTNLLNILDQQSSILIIAAAGTLVLVSGSIDLSVGATYGLSGVIAAEIAGHHSVLLAFVIAILAGVGVGLVNGVVVTFFRINPLIATLAMSFILEGLATRITSGNLVVVTTPSFADLARPSFLGVHVSVWIALVVLIAAGFLLARTTLGRYTYAVGGSREAARLAGIRVNGIKILAFALSGGAAAIGGAIDASRVLSAQATTQDSLTFTVLAGIVVGGTSILGGEGAVWRTVVGVLFIALVGNGLNLLGLDPLYAEIVLGVLLLVAVGVDAWSKSIRRRT